MAAAFALTRLYPAALAALLAAWAFAWPAAARRLKERLAGLRPGTAFLLAALVFAALAVRLASPPVHRVYYDEFEHLDAARRVAATGTFGETVAGGLPGWDVYARPPWPAGHHVALAAVFRLFGPGAETAAAWSAVLSALTLLFVFWAALELFDDERGALAAAAVWAASPVVLAFARACDLTTPSLFWTAAALAALHARARADGLDAFAGLTLAYAVQVRPENALLLGYAALAGSPGRVLLFALAAAVFPAAGALANRAAGLPGYSAASVAPLRWLCENSGPNLLWLLGRGEFLLVLLPGLFAAARSLAAARLAALSAALMLLYSAYVIGRFDSGGSARYALSALLPLCVASAAALSQAALPVSLLAAGLAFAGPPAPDARHEAARRFLAASAPALPGGAVTLAFNPSFVREAAGRPAASAGFALEDLAAFEKARAAAGAAPELVLYKDWAWRARAEDGARLEAALAGAYDARPAASDGTDSLVVLTPKARR